MDVESLTDDIPPSSSIERMFHLTAVLWIQTLTSPDRAPGFEHDTTANDPFKFDIH